MAQFAIKNMSKLAPFTRGILHIATQMSSLINIKNFQQRGLMLEYNEKLEEYSWTDEKVCKFLEILKNNKGNEIAVQMLTRTETDGALNDSTEPK